MSRQISGSVEWIFRGFQFLGHRILLRILSLVFFLIFVGEKVPRKILQENPWQNPPKFTTKIPDIFLQRGRVNKFRERAKRTLVKAILRFQNAFEYSVFWSLEIGLDKNPITKALVLPSRKFWHSWFFNFSARGKKSKFVKKFENNFGQSGECLTPLVLTPWWLKEPSPRVTIGV